MPLGQLRVRSTVLIVAVTGVALTVIIGATPHLPVAYRSPGLHVMLETGAAAVAFVSAALVHARFLQTRHLDDLVLASGLGVLSVTNLCLAALPMAIAQTGERFGIWAPLSGRFLAAVLIAASTIVPARAVAGSPRLVRGLPVIAVVALGLLALLIGVLAQVLSTGVDPALTPATGWALRPHGDGALLATQLAAAGIFTFAAVGFVRRAEPADVLRRWFAIGAALAAVSSINYFFFPSLYSEWVHAGDVFRLLSYLALLVGSGREVGRYWRQVAETAVLEERRRIARDLHDGLAQELAFITRRARRLAPESGPLQAAIDEMGVAAQHALDDSRRAIAALTRAMDEPLHVTLTQAAQEVASRLGANVTLDLAADVKVAPDIGEALAHITREAVANAGRHARATTIRVGLENGDGIRLRVVDDGAGFDLAQARTLPGRYGLQGMRARAEALGGDLRVRSVAGAGTEVEVTLP